jgi:1,4-dihydroxy-6-naphthoate synthase
MFYALAAGKIDTEGLTYVHELQDIETLNHRAMRGELEVTAVSIHAYAYLSDRYALLPHGASMGDRYGPRLVARSPMTRQEIRGKRIAIPGMLTSAYLAMRMFEPDFEAVVTPFDQIEDAVVQGKADLGLLIHEGQLTFADQGLHLLQDLGEWGLRHGPSSHSAACRAEGLGSRSYAENIAPSSRQHCVWIGSWTAAHHGCNTHAA